MKTAKLFLLSALMFFFCANLSAQVTIGALEEPKAGAILDLNSDTGTKGGLLLSNVALDNLYTIPHTGTTPFPGVTAGNYESVKAGFAGAIVYHTGENGYPAGVYLWNGENWSPAGEDCRALTDADLTLTGLPFAQVNTVASFSVSSRLSARCSERETFTWSASPGTVTFTPSNGDSLTVKLIATYRNKTNAPKVAYLEIRIEDGTCICPAKIDAGTWLNFMCHNLGDEPTLDIISSSQLITREHHGDWYRFGASQASVKNTPANDGSTGWNNPYFFPTNFEDWPAGNNPCPAGWRLPVKEEWAGAINVLPDIDGTNPVNTPNNSIARIPDPWSSSGDEFSRLLKIGDYLYIPVAGTRNWSNGSLMYRGSWIHYWSSSYLDIYSDGEYGGRTLYFTNTDNAPGLGRSGRSWGCSVRCVAAE